MRAGTTKHIFTLALCVVGFCSNVQSVIAASSALTHAEFVGIDFGPGTKPPGWNSAANGVRLKDIQGRTTNVSLEFQAGGTPFGVEPNPETVPRFDHDLSGLDGNHYQFNGTFVAQLKGLEPGATYAIWLFGLRSGANMEQRVRFEGDTRIEFVQSAGDGQLAVNHEVGNHQQALADYARAVTATRDGTIRITVKGAGPQGRPYVISGLAFAAESSTSTTNIVASSPPAPAAARNVAAAPNPPAKATQVALAIDPKRDILGVSLEMSLEEASRTLAEQKPDMRFSISEQDTGVYLDSRLRGWKFPAFILAKRQSMPGYTTISVHGYGPPHEGKVASVGRYEALPEPIPWDNMVNALVEKYGTPTFNSGQGPSGARNLLETTLSWSTDRQGRPLTNADAVKKCGGINMSQFDTGTGTQIAMEVGYVSNWKYAGFRSNCGSILEYKITAHSSRPQYATAYSAVMFDLPLIVSRNLDTIAFTAREADKIASEEAKKAESRKPTL